MKYATHPYKKLDTSVRLDAEYYVKLKVITKRYNALFNKVYKGQKTTQLHKHFEITQGDIPEVFPSLVFKHSTSGKIEYEVLTANKNKRRFNIIISPKSDEVSVFDLLHFIDHEEVRDYLKLHMIGGVMLRLPYNKIANLKIPIPKIQLGAKDIKNISGKFEAVNSEFKDFISLYYQQYSNAIKANQLVAAVMLAGAISEAILYQVILDCDVNASLLEKRGLGGLIRDVRLGKFNEIEGKEFDLEPFEEFRKIRNTIVHPSLAIEKIKTDYEFIDKQNIIKNFNRIKRFFGL